MNWKLLVVSEGGRHSLVEIHHEARFIDIWMRKDDPQTLPDVSQYLEQYPGYRVAIFRSGHNDLADLTAQLLRENL